MLLLEQLEHRLKAYYQKHAPSKLQNVEKIARMMLDKQDQLNAVQTVTRSVNAPDDTPRTSLRTDHPRPAPASSQKLRNTYGEDLFRPSKPSDLVDTDSEEDAPAPARAPAPVSAPAPVPAARQMMAAPHHSSSKKQKKRKLAHTSSDRDANAVAQLPDEDDKAFLKRMRAEGAAIEYLQVLIFYFVIFYFLSSRLACIVGPELTPNLRFPTHQANPKLKDSMSYHRYESYKAARTLDEVVPHRKAGHSLYEPSADVHHCTRAPPLRLIHFSFKLRRSSREAGKPRTSRTIMRGGSSRCWVRQPRDRSRSCRPM